MACQGQGEERSACARKHQAHRLHSAGGDDDFVAFQIRGAAIGGLDAGSGDAAARGLEVDGGVSGEKNDPGNAANVVGVYDGHGRRLHPPNEENLDVVGKPWR